MEIKNILDLVEKILQNRSRQRAWVKKLRIVVEVVRIGEQELVEVGYEKIRNRRGDIK